MEHPILFVIWFTVLGMLAQYNYSRLNERNATFKQRVTSAIISVAWLVSIPLFAILMAAGLVKTQTPKGRK